MKLKTWPIVAGTLTDLVASLAIAMFYAVALITWHVVQGTEPGDEAFAGPQFGVLIAFTLLCTVLGGFVAARMAKTLPVQHGVAVGMVVLVVSLILELISPDEDLSFWQMALSSLAAVPAGALGGYLASRRTGSTALSDS